MKFNWLPCIRLEQSQREEVMKEFKNEFDILLHDGRLAGIDINDIKLVVNFGHPTTPETCAPIGRTPRNDGED